MQLKRNAGKSVPSPAEELAAEELAKELDDIEPMVSTPRRLGFMRGHGKASAELKRGFADDINAMFSC